MSRTITAMTLLMAFFPGVSAQAKADGMPWVAISQDKKGFVLDPSGRPFVPWGFNYDHDDKARLIEDYWEDEWPTSAKGPGRSVRLHSHRGSSAASKACSARRATSTKKDSGRRLRAWQ